MKKRRNCPSGAISPLSHNIFDISLNSRVQLPTNLLNVVVTIIYFLTSANLICRDNDISKYFRQSLRIRDNESRLYIWTLYITQIAMALKISMAIRSLNLAETRIALEQCKWIGVQTQSKTNHKLNPEGLCVIVLVSLWFYLLFAFCLF